MQAEEGRRKIKMGKKNKKREFIQYATGINTYADRLFQIAVTEFKYPNMPLSVDKCFMERYLFWKGAVAFFKDEVFGLMCLPFVPQSGKIDPYGVPTEIEVYGVNSYRKRLQYGEFVIMYNNSLRQPSCGVIDEYALTLQNFDMIVKVNCNAQKTPVLLMCDEEEKLSLENLYTQYQGNAPVIKTYKSFDKTSIQVLKTDAPYIADRIYKNKVDYWNEALTYLGVSNLTVNKNQHVLETEIASSLGGVYACRNARLVPRVEAMEKVAEIFGIEVEP